MNLSSLRERLAGSYWTIPALSVCLAGLGALLLLYIDNRVEGVVGVIGFSGSATSARSLLATIATSMLSLTGLVFSITIVVLQLTSSQFSPRVLRTFLRDRQSQATLGVFVATFLYALVALREVRGDGAGAEQFVPGLTITVGFALVVISVMAFVAYIHHVTQSIRAVNIIDRIAQESEGVIKRHYSGEDEPGEERWSPVPGVPARSIFSPTKGVVVDLDIDALVGLAESSGTVIALVPQVGQFVPAGAPLLRVYGEHEQAGLDADELRRAVTLDRERTMRRDLAFGFRQLVDVAERALSPGINDPTTAVQCLDQIHNLLRALIPRPMPSGVHRGPDGQVRFYLRAPAFEDFVHLALDEIRHWGADSLQIHERMRQILDDLTSIAWSPEQRLVLSEQARLLDARLQDLPPGERMVVTQAD